MTTTISERQALIAKSPNPKRSLRAAAAKGKVIFHPNMYYSGQELSLFFQALTVVFDGNKIENIPEGVNIYLNNM